MYVRVTEMLESFVGDGRGGWEERKSTGAIRVGPAHVHRGCPFLNGSGRFTVFELDRQLLGHPIFEALGVCRHCVKDGIDKDGKR